MKQWFKQFWCSLDDHRGMRATDDQNVWACKGCGKAVRLFSRRSPQESER